MARKRFLLPGKWGQREQWLHLRAVAIASLAVTGLLVGVRQQGWLQGLELAAYDRLVQLRPSLDRDPRLLVVAITEADIQAQQTWPLPDQVFAEVLSTLERYQPRVIGLDIYRDVPVPPGSETLRQRLQASDRTVGITKLSGDANAEPIPPPPGLPQSQVGFNDVVTDPGGSVRRNLLFGSDANGTVYPSLGLVLAQRYLADQGIVPRLSPHQPQQMQLGPTVFAPLQPSDGGYVGVDARGYQILLDYRGPDSIETLSLGQVLAGRFTPRQVRDRIVLIGTTAESLKDFFYTPYSSGLREGQRMPGVILHAQAISQILDAALGKRQPVWFWPDPVEALWIGGWALAGGILAWAMRNPLGLAVSMAIALVGLLAICFWLWVQKGWIPLVPPALALTATGGSVVAYNAQQAQRQRQMVMTLLGQSTSPEIAEQLWRSRDTLLQDGKLAGQQLTATLLFTDLRGFSTVAEKMPPSALFDWLNDYLNAMTKVVHDHQGIINKFTGDGLLAVFGVPVPRQTPQAIALDAQRAVSCALEMRTRLDQLNQGWQQQGKPTVQMRVGIFTGPVVAGSLGAKQRLEYGLIGDSVNVAARLESLEKQRQTGSCRILLAAETLVQLEDQVEVEPWGQLSLRGREQAVTVYRVLQAKLKNH